MPEQGQSKNQKNKLNTTVTNGLLAVSTGISILTGTGLLG